MNSFDKFDFESKELSHHGIKGMRWGVRRTPEQLGNKTKRKDIKAEREVVSKQVREEFRVDQKYREADDKYRQSMIKRGKRGGGSKAYYQKDAKKAEREANLEVYNRMVQKYGDDYKRLLDAEERGEKIVRYSIAAGLIATPYLYSKGKEWWGEVRERDHAKILSMESKAAELAWEYAKSQLNKYR